MDTQKGKWTKFNCCLLSTFTGQERADPPTSVTFILQRPYTALSLGLQSGPGGGTWGPDGMGRGPHFWELSQNWIVDEKDRVDGKERGILSREEGKTCPLMAKTPQKGDWGWALSRKQNAVVPFASAGPPHTYTVIDFTGNTGGGDRDLTVLGIETHLPSFLPLRCPGALVFVPGRSEWGREWCLNEWPSCAFIGQLECCYLGYK